MIPPADQGAVSEVEQRAEKLKAIIRKYSAGGCRMLSRGDACECPLCLVDGLLALVADLRQQQAPDGSLVHVPRSDEEPARVTIPYAEYLELGRLRQEQEQLQEQAEDARMGHVRLDETSARDVKGTLYERISWIIELLVHSAEEKAQDIIAIGAEKDELRARAEAARGRQLAAERRAARIVLELEQTQKLKAAEASLTALREQHVKDMAAIAQRHLDAESDLAAMRRERDDLQACMAIASKEMRERREHYKSELTALRGEQEQFCGCRHFGDGTGRECAAHEEQRLQLEAAEATGAAAVSRLEVSSADFALRVADYLRSCGVVIPSAGMVQSAIVAAIDALLISGSARPQQTKEQEKDAAQG